MYREADLNVPLMPANRLPWRLIERPVLHSTCRDNKAGRLKSPIRRQKQEIILSQYVYFSHSNCVGLGPVELQPRQKRASKRTLVLFKSIENKKFTALLL